METEPLIEKSENSSFKNSGNDAIDVSGSKVILDKINITYI